MQKREQKQKQKQKQKQEQKQEQEEEKGMVQRLRVVRPSLMFGSVGPLVLTALLLPEQYATLAHAAVVTAILGAAAGVLWMGGAYVMYRCRRRQFQRVLTAEGARYRGWLPVIEGPRVVSGSHRR